RFRSLPSLLLALMHRARDAGGDAFIVRHVAPQAFAAGELVLLIADRRVGAGRIPSLLALSRSRTARSVGARVGRLRQRRLSTRLSVAVGRRLRVGAKCAKHRRGADYTGRIAHFEGQNGHDLTPDPEMHTSRTSASRASSR